eukprot:1969856-Pyramimonas_sp.AAC.1
MAWLMAHAKSPFQGWRVAPRKPAAGPRWTTMSVYSVARMSDCRVFCVGSGRCLARASLPGPST